ncbi:MAG: TIR domain-containing protein [Geminicoccaceae bacterium]
MRVFISYHTPDHDEADRLRAALSTRSPGLDFYFAPARNTVGAYWLPRLGEELEASDAVLLVLGDKVGPWQELEYYEALRLARRSGRPLIVPIVIGKVAPGLQFLDQHHQLFAQQRPLEDIVTAVLEGFSGVEITDEEPLWRRYNPYKGLAALGTEDARFFFGREAITGDILECIRQSPPRVLALIGNSGVGKSSLAQAGVIASLRSQIWAGDPSRDWPSELEDSRTWLPVTITPGETPLKELANGFVRTWAEGANTEREARSWADLLATGSGIEDLIRNTSDEIQNRTNEPPPRRILLYVDQGEELYARSDSKQAKRFSELLSEAITRPEINVLASLRSDYYGHLQADELLFAVAERIDVPPLNQAELEDVIRRPATTLGAWFETDEVIPLIAGSAAEEPGSLPLLSYLMADTWDAMRSDKTSNGVMHFPLGIVDVSRPLAERAERFLAQRPTCEGVIKRLFSLELAHVPVDGEPVRRRARKTECSAEEWEIVEQLASADWRLLSVGGDETDITVEVAHEALLRKWPRLTRWLEEEREFLVWKGQLEQTRRQYEAMAESDKKGALLMGTPLMLARTWVEDRAADLGPQDRGFIDLSIATARRGTRRTMIGGAIAIVLLLVAGASGWMGEVQRREVEQKAELQRRQVLVSLSEQKTASGNTTEGIRLALQALPKDSSDERSYLPQAEVALYTAFYRHREEQILQDDLGVVWSVGFSPDGQRLVTAGGDGTARVWDAATGADHVTLAGHEGAVRSAVFSSNAERIVTASDDGEAWVWITASGEVELALTGHDGPVHYATFSPDAAIILTASGDQDVRLWDASSGHRKAVLIGHDQAVTYATFSPDGRLVVSASRDGTARLWDVATGQSTHVLQGHSGPVAFADFSPDGRLVVTASDDTTARIWNVATGHCVHTLSGHQGRVRTALFSPDGKGVITSSDDRTARLWHASKGDVFAMLQGHERGVGAVAFSPDGRRIVAGTDSGTVHLWDAISGESIAVLRGHEGQVQSVSFSPDGQRVATASDDGTVRLWNATREANFMILDGHDDRVRGAAFSPDGQRVVSASADGTARLWDTDEGTVVAELDEHQGQVLTGAFNSDGTRFVTGSEDGTARIWDAITGESIAVLRGHGGWVRDAAFSPDGRRIVTASGVSGDGTARQWDAASGEIRAVLQGHDDKVYSAAFSADGKRIVTASADHTARVWDAEKNELMFTLQGHEGPVRSASFSSDGRLIVTASDDTTARLWHADTGEFIRVFQGHGREVRSAAFSPDGVRVITGSIDRTARIWDASTGENVAQLIGHKGPVQHTSFSADGLRVLTASSDGSLRIWSVFSTTQALIDQANLIVPQQPDPHAQVRG